MPYFYSRRDLLKLLGVTPVMAAAAGAAVKEAPWWGRALRTGPGPKLFFTAEQLPMLRRRWREGERFAALREGLLSRDRVAELKFLREEINLKDPLNDIRRAGEHAIEMAFVYLMSGDKGAADAAIESVRTIMKFPVWDFFLEGGEKVVGVQRAPSTTIAVSVVIDFLGELIDPVERKTWLQALAAKGCEPCFTGLHNVRYPRQTVGWSFNPDTPVGAERLEFPTDMARRPEITQTTNLRASPAGALAIGLATIALYGDDHSAVDRWLEMVVSHFKAFEQIYLPDGSHGEGVHYADYTSDSIIMGLQALKVSGVLALDLDINWVGHIDYMLNMAMPTTENPYEVVNISDNGRYRHTLKDDYKTGRPEVRTAVPYWVASKFRDGRAKWFGENLGALESVWSLVFYDESLPSIAPRPGRKTWFSDVDWVVARTGFKADDLLVSLRSGVGYNHEHADRNSLIVKCYGEQLIVDPIRPPYWFRDPAWILRETAGHSAVLVDGAGHLYNNGVEGTNSTICQARIVAKGAGTTYSYWVSDATQAYRVANLQIRSVVRATLVCFDLPAVVVVDVVSKWKTPSVVEARFFADNWDGQAKVIAKGQGFSIERPHAFATGEVFCREGIKVANDVLPIPAERAAQHPFVTVKSEPTMRTTLVSAVGLGRTGEAPVAVAFRQQAERIEVTLKRGAKTVVCEIVDREAVPTLRVRA